MSLRRFIGSSGVAVVANAGCCDKSSSPKKTRNSSVCAENCLERSPNAKSPSKERDELPGGSESPDNSSSAKSNGVGHYKSEILKKGECPHEISENIGTISRRHRFLCGAKDVQMSRNVDRDLLGDASDKIATSVTVSSNRGKRGREGTILPVPSFYPTTRIRVGGRRVGVLLSGQ